MEAFLNEDGGDDAVGQHGFSYTSNTSNDTAETATVNLTGRTATKSYNGADWYQWPYQQTTSGTWTNVSQCGFCNGYGHTKPEICPRVRKVSYYETGEISSIEFHKPE